MAEDQGTFDLWITDRISFTIAGGNTGDFEVEVTNRILWNEYAEAASEAAAGATVGMDHYSRLRRV